jgi:molecular chaperone IbpA
MNTLSLTPILRHSVGFDHFDRMFDTLTKIDETANAYPPYNIEKLGENQYRVTLAVAGFAESDLNIIQERNKLVVSGKIMKDASADETKTEYLHKGIATRAFERKFDLAEHVKVVGAQLENGLLNIELLREIPEAEKPRMIAINGEAQKKITKK